jgi:hypothetical protein
MKKLTTEITNVLNNPNVKKGLNIAKIEASTLNHTKNLKSSVNETFQTAKLIASATEYFKSKECKQIFVSQSLPWKLEDFFNHIGYSKAWAYKLLKAVKFGDKKFNDYMGSNQETYSIEKFNSWADDKVKPETEKAILNISYGEIKVKINAKNELISENTKAELLAIITRLTAEMSKIK